jgi:cyclic nucleotide-binding protein/MFS transporter
VTPRLRRVSESLTVFRTVFRNPDLRRLEISFSGFSMAEWATWVAIMVFAYQRGGATEAGIVALIQLVPSAIVAPLASTLADRHRRERVMVLAYLSQATAMGATALALLANAPVVLTYAFAAAAATSITLTRPAQGGLLPFLARTPEELTAANVSSGSIESVSFLAGPAAAALILGRTGAGVVFAVFAGILLGGAYLVSRISVRTADRRQSAAVVSVLKAALDGFRALEGERDSLLVVTLVAAQSLVIGALDVLIVALAITLLQLGPSGPGLLTSALGGGGLIGSAAAILLVGRRLSRPLALGIALLGLPIGVIGLVPRAGPAVTMLALSGAGRVLVDVAGRSLLQRIVADEVLARVFGILEGLYMAALAIGSIAASGLVAGLGTRGALIVTGTTLPVLAALTWPRLTKVDASAPAPDPAAVETLRAVAMFSPLSAPTLERLASRLVPVATPAGTDIVRKGEAGDRFYIVRSGALQVISSGRPIGELGPGDFFGEIALLRDVPRTATVTTRTNALLYALEREAFIQAVSGHPTSTDIAEAVVRSRLGAEDTQPLG